MGVIFKNSNFSYKLKVEAMLIKEEFAQTMDWINPAIDAIIMTAKGEYHVFCCANGVL